jgi:hypothetical protein
MLLTCDSWSSASSLPGSTDMAARRFVDRDAKAPSSEHNSYPASLECALQGFLLDDLRSVSQRVFTRDENHGDCSGRTGDDGPQSFSGFRRSGGHIGFFRIGIFVPGTARIVLECGRLDLRHHWLAAGAIGTLARFLVVALGNASFLQRCRRERVAPELRHAHILGAGRLRTC